MGRHYALFSELSSYIVFFYSQGFRIFILKSFTAIKYIFKLFCTSETKYSVIQLHFFLAILFLTYNMLSN